MFSREGKKRKRLFPKSNDTLNKFKKTSIENIEESADEITTTNATTTNAPITTTDETSRLNDTQPQEIDINTSKTPKIPESKVEPLLNTPVSNCKVCEITKRVRGVLTPDLKFSCNYKIWNGILDHICQQKCIEPFLLWGQTGSGKSTGLTKIANLCKLRVYLIEPSVTQTLEGLKRWLNDITGSKTLLGPRMIIIDVVEGLDTSFISIIEQFLKSHKTKLKVPIAVIIEDAYNYNLKSLINIFDLKYRCYRPSPEKCAEFAKMTFAPEKTESDLIQYAEKCNCDLRCLKNMVGFSKRPSVYTSHIHVKLIIKQYQVKVRLKNHRGFFTDINSNFTSSVFESTNKLLLGTLHIENWQKSAEKQSLLNVITDSYLNLLTTIEDAEIMAEYLLCTHEMNLMNDEFHYDSFIAGSSLKMMTNFETLVPKLTMTSKPLKKLLKPIKSAYDYQLSFSRLQSSQQILGHETFYIDRNHA